MTDSTNEERGRIVKSVKTTGRILDRLQQIDSAGITELAQDLDLSKATVYNHLVTLEEMGYVVRNGEKYELSLLFLYYGKTVQRNRRLYQAGRETIDELAEESGEYAHLVVEENGRAITLYKAQGERAVPDRFPVGQRDFLHPSAAGKAILSYLPTDRVKSIIEEQGLPSLTENTITDPESLFEELEVIEERGYSLNLEEEVKGINAVGVPVMSEDETVLGAVSISGPTTRLTENRLENDILNTVRNGVNVMEIEINERWETMRKITE